MGNCCFGNGGECTECSPEDCFEEEKEETREKDCKYIKYPKYSSFSDISDKYNTTDPYHHI